MNTSQPDRNERPTVAALVPLSEVAAERQGAEMLLVRVPQTDRDRPALCGSSRPVVAPGDVRLGGPLMSLCAFLCRVGLHRWAKLGTTTWLDLPTPFENRYGVAMESRACERCGRLRDVTTWFDTPDPDYGVPRKLGPLAGARFLEIISKPGKPLPADPIPMSCLPKSWKEL